MMLKRQHRLKFRGKDRNGGRLQCLSCVLHLEVSGCVMKCVGCLNIRAL